MSLERWRSFFQEVAAMVTTTERHYDVCNANYCDLSCHNRSPGPVMAAAGGPPGPSMAL